MTNVDLTGNNGAISPRELVAFAFVEEAYSKTGDLVAGLVPLFVPILAKRANRRFDPAEFSSAVEKAYDIPMSPLVAAGLAEKLAEFRLLRIDPGEPHTYRVEPSPHVETPLNDSGINQLLASFSQFASESLKKIDIHVPDDSLQNAFLKRLTSVDFLSFVDRREKNYYKGKKLVLNDVVDDEQDAVHLDQALDVLSAAFALQTIEQGGSGADLITRLTGGALIAEVVLTLQVPSSSAALNNISMSFDGPLILDFLDLSTPELHDFSKDLFALIEKAGIRKVVFAHVVAEMKGTLRGPLEAMQRGETPFGPLGNRIRSDSSHAGYARATLDNLESQLVTMGFEILDANTCAIEDLFVFCDLATEEGLRNTIGPLHTNLERRIRDARSIATVLRLRGAIQHAKSIADAKWLFVTRNDVVASKSSSFVVYKNLLKRDDVPAALTDRRLAGYLWFAVGGNLGNLSRKKLIANCSYVMNPQTDLVSKVRQYLTELDPKKAEIFMALMRDQRAQRCLVQSTMAFPSLIRLDNVDDLLEVVRLSTAEEVRTIAEQREAALTREHSEALAVATKRHADEEFERQSQILRLEEAHAHQRQAAEKAVTLRDGQIGDLANRLSEIEVAANANIDLRMEKALRSAENATQLLKWALFITYLIAVGTAYWYAPTDKTPSFFFVTLLLAAIGYWMIPAYIFDTLRRPLWLWKFHGRCEELQVSQHLSKFQIDD
ncbi:MAG: hypothetical protein HHJ16_09325, partial [Polaromonas sp.]|uniref:hypothetical protein n=1 Tax=Polaromonas sp. TaxID=1869339 RepID=UPI0017FC7692